MILLLVWLTLVHDFLLMRILNLVVNHRHRVDGVKTSVECINLTVNFLQKTVVLVLLLVLLQDYVGKLLELTVLGVLSGYSISISRLLLGATLSRSLLVMILEVLTW